MRIFLITWIWANVLSPSPVSPVNSQAHLLYITIQADQPIEGDRMLFWTPEFLGKSQKKNKHGSKYIEI